MRHEERAPTSTAANAQAQAVGARVTVVTRVDCHLCDVAEDAIARIAAEAGVGWCTVDVDADPALLDEYSDLVPVILVDGRMHGYWRVEEDRLRAALARPPATS